MTGHNKNISLVDPLSEVTRKERRMLLGLSMLGIFFVKAGILPTKISALGVDLATNDQGAFLFLTSLVLLYFTVAFFIYAMSDFIVWRKSLTELYLLEYRQYMQERDYRPQSADEAELEEEETRAHKRNAIWLSLTKPMSIFRAIFEFALPLFVGLYSIFIMVQFASKTS
jgi:Ca2+/Na+ antiporter